MQIRSSKPARSTTGRRRATAYVLALSSSLIVLTIGMSALASSRAQRAALAQGDQAMQMQHLAHAAAHQGLATINSQIAIWAALGAGLTTDRTSTLAGGEMRWRLRNSAGAVPTSLDRPLFLQTAATLAPAGAYEQVELRARRTPFAILTAAVGSAAAASISGSGYIAPIGGQLASTTSTTVSSGSYVFGDSRSFWQFGSGMTTGVQTQFATALAWPPATVDDDYYSWATPLGTSGDLDRVVLGPNVNPFGAPDPDGMYRMSLTKNTTIQRSRILGTLIVKTNGSKLTLDQSLRMGAYRSDYPVLIVDGDLELKFTGGAGLLSEASEGVNFNPSGVPYLGVTDSDNSDTYPSELVGLVHATGTVTVIAGATPYIRGLLLSNGNLSVSGGLVVYRDSKLYTDPPIGYGTPARVETKPDTWKRIAAW